ncbi:MAG: hypothetical protein KF726_14230 [Anaerolineae bacterium]|nr:hypothetical protein [Anaerolineae bacterium]
MATSASMLKSLLSIFGIGRVFAGTRNSTRIAAPTMHSTEFAPSPAIDEEQAFLASIADLGLEEQQKRIQRREWYKSLAERQAIADVEYQMGQQLRSDSRLRE